jgi:ribosome-binding protein aMBF1 (putative translation factor)
MHDLDEIRERMAALELERQAKTLEAQRDRQQRRRRSHTPRARERMSRIQFRRQRSRALASPTCHPLRRARLTFQGDGLTIDQLASRSLVSASYVQRIEAGTAEPGPVTVKRLARALRTSPKAISPEA